MSKIIEELEQLAISTLPQSQRHGERRRLAEQTELPAAIVESIATADLSGLIQTVGLTGRGCFIIVAPDEPAQPDDDEPEDPPVKIRRH